MITVLADSYIPYLDKLLPEGCVLNTYSTLYPDSEQLRSADALLIRTTTKVDELLLQNAPKLKFLATGSAGFNHVNTDALSKQNIHFSYAPGCNARAVAEYVLTGILLWADRNNHNLNELSLGIMGCGHAGSEVSELAQKAGLRCVHYDPPKARRGAQFTSASAEELLQCDIISFHCSLDEFPEYPSWHWLNESRLSKCKAKLIINAARGGVTDEKALLKWKAKTGSELITDVWENEPEFSIKLINNSFFATPHIAGYSVECKWRATEMMMADLAAYFGLEQNSARPVEADIFKSNLKNASLSILLLELHPIMEYDHRLRQLPEKSALERKVGFDKLRRGFPLRREFYNNRIDEQLLEKHPILAAFEFHVDEDED